MLRRHRFRWLQIHPPLYERGCDNARQPLCQALELDTIHRIFELSRSRTPRHSKEWITGLGMQPVGRNLRITYNTVVYTDASAALGIVRRRGLGRIRHLDVTDLWLQERVRQNDFGVRKIAGSENMAGALTKHVARPHPVKHLIAMNRFPETGRASAAPLLM